MSDLRYSLRVLIKNPAFTAMAVLSLTLGIGANAAIFSLLDAVLLKSLAVKQPEQLVFLETGEPSLKRSTNITYRTYERLRAQNQVLADACYFGFATRVNASFNGSPEVVQAQLVSGSFFSTLGINAALGRTFTETEDKENSAQQVAVLGDAYWKRQFGASPLIVGQNLIVNNRPFTVIGVAPAEFFGVIVGSNPDVFLPSRSGDLILPRRTRISDSTLPFILARLQNGASEEQARSALSLIAQQTALEESGAELTPEKQQAIQRQSLRLVTAAQGFNALRQEFSSPLRLLMVVVGLVLLIACANVANLLLARAAAREKEIALRLALGAPRWRIVKQLLTESLLLAFIGGAFGLLLASWSTSLLLKVLAIEHNSFSGGAPVLITVPFDVRIVSFTAVVSVIAAVVFGLAPAWRASKFDLTPSMKESRTSGGKRWFGWGRTLVVTQVALSLTLLVGAGLFIRSLVKLRSVDVGFQREQMLLFSIDPQLSNYGREQIRGLYRQMLERIGSVPGVTSVSLSRQGLLSGSGTQGSITVPGFTPPAQENQVVRSDDSVRLDVPYLSQVGPNFFRTLGMTIVRGRDIGPRDNETAPKVTVVNEAFARYYFGSEDPIGRRFDRGEQDGGEVEIVGVVKDAKAESVKEQTPRTYYVPFLQDPSSWRETTFQVRTAGDPLETVAAIRHEVQSLEPNLPLFRIKTLEQQVDETLAQERLVTTLASLFGVLALLLACAGLYGVLSYSVSRRTREIGIRMALGAKRGDVLRFFVGQGMVLVLFGVLVGLAAAFALTRFMSSLLFGISNTDFLTFAGVAVGLAVVALFACYIPARRATKVDPSVALRSE
jgi:predicted permease